jgi:hypothetical protein
MATAVSEENWISQAALTEAVAAKQDGSDGKFSWRQAVLLKRSGEPPRHRTDGNILDIVIRLRKREAELKWEAEECRKSQQPAG